MIGDCIGRSSFSFHFYILLLVISGSVQDKCILKGKALQAQSCSCLLVAVWGCLHLRHWNVELASEEQVEAHEAQVLTGSQPRLAIHKCQWVLYAQRGSERTHFHCIDPRKRQLKRKTHIMPVKGTINKKSWSVIHISIWTFLNGYYIHQAPFE